MKPKTIAKLIKLRQYQLELEQWKLHQKQLEEQKASQAVKRGEQELIECYGDGLLPVNPIQAAHTHQYIQEATVNLKTKKRKRDLAHQAAEAQVAETLKAQQRREMLTRLQQHAVEAERLEFDRQERKLLDDVAQLRFLKKKQEVIV